MTEFDRKQLEIFVEKIKESVYRKVGQLQAEILFSREPICWEEAKKGNFCSIDVGKVWGGLFDCAWFRFTGEVPKSCCGKSVALRIDVDGEGCVYDENGVPMRGLTNINSEFDRSLGLPGKRIFPISHCAAGGEKIAILVDAGCNDLFGKMCGGTLKECDIVTCDEKRREFYYDFAVLLNLAAAPQLQESRRTHLKKILSEAARIVGEAKDAEEEKIVRADDLLKSELSKPSEIKDYAFTAIGHAHLDLAWLWPIRETKRKAERTFSTAIALLKEYPEYIAGFSQPQQFEWTELRQPELFARIREAVLAGRIEVQGVMWVEPDMNLTGGESIVRQILYGKRYFREKFGQAPRICHLPDVFGFNAALPQILKKSHTDFMLTIKLSWNKHNKFPYHTFRWEGIDGTEILVHMPPNGTYNDSLQPAAILNAYEKDGEKNLTGEGLILYGIGDGGGGPGRDHLERLRRVRTLSGLPPVRSRTTREFFDNIAMRQDMYPHYSGELYLEKHQATYTTQARNKRYNRLAERDLRTMDLFYAAAYLAGASDEQEASDRIWKEILLYQFHDILPGSSIARVYHETDKRYPVLLAEIARLTQKAADVIGKNVPFNPICAVRKEIAEDGRVICFDGYGEASRTERAGAEPIAEEGRLENAFLIAKFDKSGNLAALIRKADGKNYLRDLSDRFVLYEDSGDGWDFGEGYLQKDSIGEFITVGAKWFVQEGCAVAEFERVFGRSKMIHRVKLNAVKEYLEFETEGDWQERKTLLRAEFVPAIWCDTVNCGIQFGNFVRSTREETAVERAQEEICAQRYVDMSCEGGGLAVFAEDKFGYRVKRGKILLSLLRGSEYPGEDADRGRQVFRYALYPHAKAFAFSAVTERAYEYLYPILSCTPSGLPHWRADGVQLEAVKIAEDKEGIVFRFYEAKGRTGYLECTDQNARLCEMSIDEEELYGVIGNVIAFAPYEIKTLKLTVKGRENKA